MLKYLVAVILIILVIGGYFYFKPNLASNPQPQKYIGSVEKITVGEIESYAALNLIAKEKGFFAENGLDVEIKDYQSGPPEFDDLLTGKIDIAIAAEFVGVSYMFTHQDLNILSEVATNEVFEVIGRKSKGIKTPGDLKGKKIGVTKKSAGEFYLGKFLTFNQLSLKDVTLVDMLPPEMVDHLEKGDGVIDAAVFFPRPWNLQQKLGTDSISWSVQGGQKTFGLIFSTDSFIKAHSRTIERYLHSLTEAEQYYKDHQPEVKDLVAKTFHHDDSYIQDTWSKFDFSIRLDQVLMFAMEDEARWVINNKLTDQTKVPNYLNYIYFDALTKVRPEAVTIVH